MWLRCFYGASVHLQSLCLRGIVPRFGRLPSGIHAVAALGEHPQLRGRRGTYPRIHSGSQGHSPNWGVGHNPNCGLVGAQPPRQGLGAAAPILFPPSLGEGGGGWGDKSDTLTLSPNPHYKANAYCFFLVTQTTLLVYSAHNIFNRTQNIC